MLRDTVKLCMALMFGTDISGKNRMRVSASCHPAREAFLGETRWECTGRAASWDHSRDTGQSRLMVALSCARTRLVFAQLIK